MTTTRIAQLTTAVATALLASGCSHTKIPSPADLPIVYKIDVQQGNEVTQDMLAQLKPGMERAKVKFIMGTPLVVDTFHNDRWDYVYTMQKRGGERVQRRVSLYFRDDKLERVAGDVRPAAGAIAQSTDRASTTVEVPPAEKGLFTRVSEKVGGDADKKKAAEPSVSNEAGDAAPTASDEAASNATGSAPSDASASGGPAPTATEGTDGFVIDNGGGTASDANPVAQPAEGGEESVAPAASSGDGVLPQFQSESNLDDAVLRESSDVAAEAASGADANGDAAKDGASAAGGSGKSTEVTIPDDAPPPKSKKGFFGRLLEKVGVGDDDSSGSQPADATHRDVSDPANQ